MSSTSAAVRASLFPQRWFAVGLMFLLSEEDQRKLIDGVGRALKPGGRFLFSAPRIPCEWDDFQTGLRSVSQGEAVYQGLLAAAGMRLEHIYADEGGNHYLDACAILHGALK